MAIRRNILQQIILEKRFSKLSPKHITSDEVFFKKKKKTLLENILHFS